MRQSERVIHSGTRRRALYRLAGAAVALLASMAGAAAQSPAFIPNNITTSTVPPNGDLNPYGVAFVPSNFPVGGTIAPGEILVSNFNNLKNLQGTGTTIIKVTPNGVITPGPVNGVGTPGTASVFFQSTNPKETGLDTALGILQKGLVLCAFLPSTDGTFKTHASGGILVLNNKGVVVNKILASTKNGINSPWDMTIFDQGSTAIAFVSNVGNANNKGFVTRLDLSVSSTKITLGSATIIASGYMAQPNTSGFVTGPTGLVYNPTTDTLYVASTLDNAIYAVAHAGRLSGSGGKGSVIFNDKSVLFGPLALAQAPNGDLITANSDLTSNADATHPSEYVEFTTSGSFVSQFNIDVNQGGAFGIAAGTTTNGARRLAVVDDNVPDFSIFTGLPPSINGAER
jgi:hypothetical protein